MRLFFGSGAMCAALLLVPASAQAEVVSAAEDGFVLSGVQTLSVSPRDAWAMLIKPAVWWESTHSWSGDAANMSLDPSAGGCFCESLPESGGSVQHMTVLHARPHQLLVMQGALGPLQSEPLAGVLTVTIEPLDQGGSRMNWTYVVGGYAQLSLTAMAAPVDQVMTQQFRRLAMRLDHE